MLNYSSPPVKQLTMAFSKAKLFPPLPYQQSFWSKAQSHPARIIILTHLLENGTSSFQEICKKIPLASTTVSQHLRFLLSGGFIDAKEKFPHTYYTLNRKVCKNLSIEMTELQIAFIQKSEGP